MNNFLKFLIIFTMLFNSLFSPIKILNYNINFYIIIIFITLFYIIYSSSQNKLKILFTKDIIIGISFYLFLIIIGMFSLTNHLYINNKIGEISILVSYLFLLIVLISNLDEKFMTRIFIFLYLIFNFLLISSVCEIIFGYHFNVPNFMNVNDNPINIDKFATGFFYNPNNLSVVLLVLFMFTYSKFQSKLVKILQVFFLVYIFKVNDSTICLVVLIAFILLINFKNIKNMYYKILIISLATSISYLIYKLLENYLFLFSNKLATEKSTTLNTRIYLIKNGLDLSQQNILGYGPGMFNKVYRGSIETGHVLDPHCLFIEILVNYGIIGLLILLLFLFIVFKSAFELKRINNQYTSIAYLSILLVPLFFVVSTSMSFSIFWIIMNLIIIVNGKEKLNNNSRGNINA